MIITREQYVKVLENSVTNWPVQGVSVIEFSPGARGVVAWPEHELWKNTVDGEGHLTWPLSAEMNRDRYLVLLAGQVELLVARSVGVEHQLMEHEPLSGASFLPHRATGSTVALYLMDEPLKKQTEIPAGTLVSFYVPQNTVAAWLEFHDPVSPGLGNLSFNYTNLAISAQRQPIPEETLQRALAVLDIQVRDMSV